MERLTIRTYKGAALKMDDAYPDESAARKDLMDKYLVAIDRLAAYEDTGLKPEEITELMAAHGEAILVLSEYYQIGPVKHLQELSQAEKDGRLVVQKHGEWETHLLPLAWKCSVCGFKNSFRTGRTTEYLNYCPCCGAKMDKEADDEAD